MGSLKSQAMRYGRCPQKASQLLTRFNIFGAVPTLLTMELPVQRQHGGAMLLRRIGFPPACVTSPAVLKLGQHPGDRGAS
jgi:hypothetical protein